MPESNAPRANLRPNPNEALVTSPALATVVVLEISRDFPSKSASNFLSVSVSVGAALRVGPPVAVGRAEFVGSLLGPSEGAEESCLEGRCDAEGAHDGSVEGMPEGRLEGWLEG